MNYHGYLSPHVDTIVALHGDGRTPREIAVAIYAQGARADTSEPRCRMRRDHHIANLATMVSYVLGRYGATRWDQGDAGSHWADKLSARVRNGLNWMLRDRDGDLSDIAEAEAAKLAAVVDWTNVPNFGRRSRAEIRTWLASHGLGPAP